MYCFIPKRPPIQYINHITYTYHATVHVYSVPQKKNQYDYCSQ